MPSEEWPTTTIQRAILRDFAKWLNRGTVKVTFPVGHKMQRMTDAELNTAVDRFLQEQGDGMRREAI